MKEPRRWLDEGAPEDIRRMLEGAREPAPMNAETRARGRRAIGRIATLPVGLAAWMGTKGAVAAMGTFAAVSATTFVVIETRAPSRDAAVAPVAAPARALQRAGTRGPRASLAEAPEALPDSSQGEGARLADPGSTAAFPEAPTPPPESDITRRSREPSRLALPAPSGPGKDALLAESRLLEAARRDLVAHPGAALGACAEHRRLYPSGQLASERVIIEIDALRRLGRGAEARARAEAILRQQPDGLYAERVRKLMAEIEN